MLTFWICTHFSGECWVDGGEEGGEEPTPHVSPGVCFAYISLGSWNAILSPRQQVESSRQTQASLLGKTREWGEREGERERRRLAVDQFSPQCDGQAGALFVSSQRRREREERDTIAITMSPEGGFGNWKKRNTKMRKIYPEFMSRGGVRGEQQQEGLDDNKHCVSWRPGLRYTACFIKGTQRVSADHSAPCLPSVLLWICLKSLDRQGFFQDRPVPSHPPHKEMESVFCCGKTFSTWHVPSSLF